MKVAHVVPCNSARFVSLYELLRDDENEHEFITCVSLPTLITVDPMMLCIKNLVCMPTFSFLRKLNRLVFLYKKIKDADLVIWHSLQTNGGNNVWILLMKKIRKKSCWITNSSELGENMSFSGKIMRRISPIVYKFIRTRFGYYASNVLENTEARRTAPNGTKLNALLYPDKPFMKNFLSRIENGIPKEEFVESVMVGIGSSSRNNQEELIERFVDFNSAKRIVVPMAYECRELGEVNLQNAQYYKTRKYCKKKRNEMIVDDGNISFIEHPFYLVDGKVNLFILANILCQVRVVYLGNNLANHLNIILPLAERGVEIWMEADSEIARFMMKSDYNVHFYPKSERIDGSFENVGEMDLDDEKQEEYIDVDIQLYFDMERIKRMWEDFFHGFGAMSGKR